jgi:hypothetical protein
VAPILARQPAGVPVGSPIVTDLWYGLQETTLAEKEGKPVDEALRKRVRAECVPPPDMDFRIHGAGDEAKPWNVTPQAVLRATTVTRVQRPPSSPAAAPAPATTVAASADVNSVVEAWPQLPDEVKRTILNLVRNAMRPRSQ